ncbi:hypothetical protein V500_04218 [Pseudogymnoascus sp. VKM F-4518 (FW-2643)]|nr:hypothetical protein V500_04218 [Pseudogymnoascus sp. VKM F-4518 (FW-2643)]
MLQRVVFWGLLFGIQYAGVAAQSITWKTPTKADLKANTQDSVWLDWSSSYTAPILRMWCKNQTDGDNLALVSHFKVDTNGPFEYIMDSFLEPNTMKMPLSCQPELAKDDEDDNGVLCPVGIVWSYDASLAMKTVSQAQAAVTTGAAVSKPSTPSPSSTPTPTSDPPSPTGTVTTRSPSQATVSPSNTQQSTEKSTEKSSGKSTEQSTADSSSGSTTNPTSSTDQSSTSSTTGSAQPSTPSTAGLEVDSKSGSGATTAPVASASSSSNNTGAIVGGVVGGIAVISFIIFAFLFLRRQKRNNRKSFSPVTNESSIWNLYFFNSHKKRILKEDAAPVYEKEGGGMARELEANPAGGKAVPYDPVELPAGSNYYR